MKLHAEMAAFGGKLNFLFFTSATKPRKEIGEITLKPVSGGLEVANVLVWPEFQRKGFATAFYKHAFEFARKRGKKLFASDDRTSDALALSRTLNIGPNLEIMFEANDSVFQPMDVKLLRLTIRRNSPVFEAGKSSGFHVEDVDGEQATVTWRNNGTDEAIHRDEVKNLAGTLNHSGYEVRVTKPANTTLIVRKVQPVITHGAAVKENHMMGPFELQVEGMCEMAERMPKPVSKVLKAARQSARDAGRPVKDAYGSKSIYGHDEWIVGSNFEDGSSSMIYRDNQWYYRDPHSGNDKLMRGGQAEAEANADLMFHG